MDRPTIFISSTVHDFGDLRSALKDYLEMRGCKVFSSEFADFPRAFDKHSYEECLETIALSNVFVLLIGKRSGGWYDEKKRISITRAEFEHAIKLAEAGQIRILTFVRRDVFDYHIANKELGKTLTADPAIDDVKRNEILYRDTKLMDNPRAISEFIDAVTRNHETAAAVRGIGKAPVANWIQPFSTFAEIRQSIDPLVTGGMEVWRAAGRKALETQLLVLLSGILPKNAALSASFPHDEIRALVDRIDLSENAMAKDIRIERKAFAQLTSFATMAASARADPAPLQHALTSDLLMSFDAADSRFEETPEYDLLVRIIADCHALSSAVDHAAELLIADKGQAPGKGVAIPGRLVAEQLVRLTRWAELIAGSRSLARSLRGGPLQQVLPIRARRLSRLPVGSDVDSVKLEEVRAYVDAWGPAKT